MYTVSNQDIKKIEELLSRAPELRTCTDDYVANFLRQARKLAAKLQRKKPVKDSNYQAVVKVRDGGMDISELVQAAALLPSGTYGATLTRLHNPRTVMQNRYLWAVVYPHVLRGLQDAGWDDFTSVDEVHEFMKARFGATKAVNRATGETVEFPSSTAKMDTGQMSAYIDKVRDFAEEYLGTYIPEPR